MEKEATIDRKMELTEQTIKWHS